MKRSKKPSRCLTGTTQAPSTSMKSSKLKMKKPKFNMTSSLFTRHVISSLGLKITEDQIKEMIKVFSVISNYFIYTCFQKADRDGDGDVNYLEFMRMMRN